jgi:protein tyrosine/serine phosphatase
MFLRWTFLLFWVVFDANAFSLKKLTEFNNQNRQKFAEFLDNFYEVEKGKFYRSHQLSEKTLDKYLKQYQIKTLVSLKGDENSEWWKAEKATAERNGVLFFSLFMSVVYITSKEELMKILTIFQDAPRPILVHCAGGADRTGEVSALWVLDQQGKNKTEAHKQLSIKYGHRMYKNSAKDFLIEIWQGRDWAINKYNDSDYPAWCRPKK